MGVTVVVSVAVLLGVFGEDYFYLDMDFVFEIEGYFVV